MIIKGIWTEFFSFEHDCLFYPYFPFFIKPRVHAEPPSCSAQLLHIMSALCRKLYGVA